MNRPMGRLWAIQSDRFGAYLTVRASTTHESWLSFFCSAGDAKIVAPQYVTYRNALCLGVQDTQAAALNWRYNISLDLRTNQVRWELESQVVCTEQSEAAQF